MGSDGCRVVCGDWEGDRTVQVRSSSCRGAARADSPGTQVAGAFRPVAARCAVHSLSHPTVFDALTIVLALPITLDVPRSDLLAQLASWPSISTLRVRLAITLALDAPGAFPIDFDVVSIDFGLPIALDIGRCLLVSVWTSWRPISTWCVPRVVVLASRTFPDAVYIASCRRIAFRVLWVLWSLHGEYFVFTLFRAYALVF